MKTKRVIGEISLVIGLALILNSFLDITGFVIAESLVGNRSVLLGIVLIIGGSLLIIQEAREKREGELETLSKSQIKARNIMKQRLRGGMDDIRSLRKLIQQAGYELVDGGDHEKVYRPDGKPVMSRNGGPPVTIKRHAGDMPRPEYIGIIKNVLNDFEQRYPNYQ